MSVQRSSAPSGPEMREIASLSFEEALGELEGIVKVLESGSVTLAQAIETYERGTALRRYCEDKLSEAEAKVRAVVEGGNGLSVRAVE